ncbi:AAA family ATPase [Muricauda sp. JGD-17]|uniref:AAA family ATPase n=1 Tax=Flagellimonas ochracea TaxID=2696472 RepID=A0A964TCA0_9FLAO|nr:AAA family ATPase [Allomuricauda ochracea]NAY91383.1 AAA family ATPase [Allomuricauda ochracea]
MNIKSVKIRNYRNFKNFNIDFSEGFQTIIGENNIGKSNLYWAIRLVLDRSLSYNVRNLDIKDIHGFKNEIGVGENVIISVELFSENLAAFPTFHSFKTSDNTARITYLFAHRTKFIEGDEVPDKIEISQFRWQLYAGGNSLNIDDILKLDAISFRDLEGINLYYINAFRNINSDLHGNTKSLLSKYCQSRENSEVELESVKTILKSSSSQLNDLEFIPDVAKNIQEKGGNIAGQYFSFPISISFLSNFDVDAWSQLNLFYNPNSGNNVPIQSLGLGQKNILYLSLFIAELENSSNNHEINLLLIEEPEAHLHPQLQKILFSNLNVLKTTQVFMTSHSTHIASDCEFKNLNVLFQNSENEVKSYAPFKDELLSEHESKLLKRYLDATRSEMFFASAILFVEGVGEQFIIPSISKEVFGVNLTEHNISVIPIHSRFFEPYLKLVQNNNLEIPVSVLIDGDKDELDDGEEATTAVKNAVKLAVENRVIVSPGVKTLEIDLFPTAYVNNSYLKASFVNLGHEKSYDNLVLATKENPELWESELLKRIDNTVMKGRFAQELSLLIDKDFVVPEYIDKAISHITTYKKIEASHAK